MLLKHNIALAVQKYDYTGCINGLCGSWLTEVESRTQGSRPRPRTQKNFEAKDTPSRGQGQEPRTKMQVFSKNKKQKTSTKFFFGRSQKKGLQKIFFQAIST